MGTELPSRSNGAHLRHAECTKVYREATSWSAGPGAPTHRTPAFVHGSGYCHGHVDCTADDIRHEYDQPGATLVKLAMLHHRGVKLIKDIVGTEKAELRHGGPRAGGGGPGKKRRRARS